ncbi:NrdH-redoxin [Arthrobacter sp. MYb211]|uniref:NrdH-redoxin n=1 Tax=unclassified Arthrobacter TaxID=235627 RepID=UPI000CFDEF26|nr:MULTISPECIES: NrdH-redoxin [unclassified Arthrobacter]PRA13302.1 NrdH-redoxin [Arthrobacter sp. MYb221]PRC10499.1 NrdH-redoxin [Arthrobacter sp. MYb211]
MTINLYTPAEGCVQCNATIRTLDKLGVKYNKFTADPAEDVDGLLGEAIRERAAQGNLGQQFPFVQIFNEEHELTAEWCGNRPDMIATHVQAAL